MFRWLFLFLLLANAVLLFWHSIQLEPEANEISDTPQQLSTLKLVAEMDQSTLDRLKVDSADQKECIWFTGFDSDVKAAAVTQFIVGLGGQAEYKVIDTVATDYVIVISLPQDLEKRLALMDYLEKQKLSEVGDELLDFEYSLEGYRTKESAVEQVTALSRIEIDSRIEMRESNKKHYIVTMDAPIDRNLSNKIKEIVKENYSFIKIEKKLCKRVAKP
ncbi:hypothetical protein ACMXYV_16710 [Neptuniibacter sp. SY11_33]|uniref:hypothetical protein n=1 Tax=Neptuniibacter sp. SY11_33 TaxID=3398215 RepID=UPI0039F5B702